MSGEKLKRICLNQIILRLVILSESVSELVIILFAPNAESLKK